MTKIKEEFPIGNVDEMDVKELARVLQEMYRDLAVEVNKKPSIITRFDSAGTGIDGQTTDNFPSIGDINVNQTTDTVEVLTRLTNPQTVVWTGI